MFYQNFSEILLTAASRQVGRPKTNTPLSLFKNIVIKGSRTNLIFRNLAEILNIKKNIRNLLNTLITSVMHFSLA